MHKNINNDLDRLVTQLKTVSSDPSAILNKEELEKLGLDTEGKVASRIAILLTNPEKDKIYDLIKRSLQKLQEENPVIPRLYNGPSVTPEVWQVGLQVAGLLASIREWSIRLTEHPKSDRISFAKPTLPGFMDERTIEEVANSGDRDYLDYATYTFGSSEHVPFTNRHKQWGARDKA